MRTATHRTRTSRERPDGIFDTGTDYDETVCARLGAECCPFHAADFDLVEHVKNVARVVEAARRRPFSGWAA